MSIFSRLFGKGQEAEEESAPDVPTGAPTKECSKCGATWEQGAAFCGECGAPIGAQQSAAPPAAAKRATKSGNTDPEPRPAATTKGGGKRASAGRYSLTTDEAVREPPVRTTSSAATPAARGAASARPSLSDAALAELFSPADAATGTRSESRSASSTRPSASAPPAPASARASGPPVASFMTASAAPTPSAPPAAVAAMARASSVGAGSTQDATPVMPPSQPKPRRAPPPVPKAAYATPPAAAPAAPPAPAPAAPPAPAPVPAAAAAASAPAAAPADAGAKKKPASLYPPPDAGFQKLLDDLDEGFDSIVRESVPNGDPNSITAQRPIMDPQELFEQLAADYVRPVRDFMIELRWADPRREWIDICLPAVKSLRKSAATMEMQDLVSALDAYAGALEAAGNGAGAVLGESAKEPLLTAYARLTKLMPDGFALDAERDRREPIIVQSLLLQLPEVRKVTLDKLYAAGLTRLDMYFVSKPDDIAATAGLEAALATRIVEKFRAYRQELEAPPDEGRAKERARLAELCARLRSQNEDYDRAAASWARSAAVDRRRIRLERDETVLQVNVLLARLGEVDRLNEIEKLPYSHKVRALESYLEQATQRSLASSALGGPSHGRSHT